MRTYDYIQRPKELFSSEIIRLITQIHEHKGKQELFIDTKVARKSE